ncbi:FAD-binding oxidoreductase [Roseovarius salinarum]|uniref:FAD-binding oxidoreductase n=1 Tax=Roseovarius salinarum TaxID=1981892 RepID=UPI000C322574|nr:FAD-binding oxidoreductase [Roseovarius salinarum]
MKLAGWGRYPVADCRLRAPRDADAITAALADGPLIARGAGRAYGDSAMSAANTLEMRHFNRMLAFDPDTGRLEAEAGVLLADIIASFLPRGWFPAVTPGTKFVSLGGMIAADVHGKNHHRDGTFGNFVDWIDVMGAEGQVRRCSRGENPDLFAWTLGGMGLTGVILRAAIRLRPVESGWIRQETRPAPDLDAAMAAFEATGDRTYSVAWLDCLARGRALGRSLLMLGEHALRADLPATLWRDPFGPPATPRGRVPLDLPGITLNRYSVGLFNAVHYRLGARRAGPVFEHWDRFFYPLDGILGWNRIYGRRGFVQFQCALPEPQAHRGLEALLRTVSDAGQGSFLAVLKKFGAETGRFSFPMPGYTLSLDFPVSTRTLRLMDQLDQITLDHGGRFYLAKDARMSAATLHASDDRADAFARMRRQAGHAGGFASMQSERLGL